MMNSTYDNQFTGMVKTHSSILFFVAYRITKNRMVSEDIVQEAFLRLWKHREKVLCGNPGGWLHRVVCNLGYNHIKNESDTMKLYQELGASLNTYSTDAEEHLIRKENDQLFNTLVSRMPHKQQVVYHLSREEGLKRNEIATQLNLSPNTVKVHLLRAVQFMKEHIACILLFLFFFVFNNFIFKYSNTNERSADLDSSNRAFRKTIPGQTVSPVDRIPSGNGKTILLTIVPFIQ
ncbi:MAG: sigma-70 family RNA polymerase sigma factor [Chitinophagaceae bacterium]|nr:sigma-70 family RNA polymerase sigma factor [Chitinophagaceae bacterium]